jgi:hypothetical protein
VEAGFQFQGFNFQAIGAHLDTAGQFDNSRANHAFGDRAAITDQDPDCRKLPYDPPLLGS